MSTNGDFTTWANGEGVTADNPPALDFGTMLAARRFDVENKPPKPPPIFTLDGHTIATPGNLVAVQAKAKAGKTGGVGAMLAATMVRERSFLGFQCSEMAMGAVVHLDTEQSRFDHFHVVDTALRRANLATPPPWFRSYCVTDLAFHERRDALLWEIERAHRETGCVLAALVDGIGDLVASTNDELEAIALLNRLHTAAIQFETVIVCVLHENPGTEIGKTRGHLGSHLERKAETNLRLEKEANGTTVIYTERARHCHIPRNQGPRFEWSTEHGMHVPVGSVVESKEAAKWQELYGILERVFSGKTTGALSWSDLHDAIGRVAGLKRDGARRKFKDMQTLGLITRNPAGKWAYLF